jgi:hypothetical protein
MEVFIKLFPKNMLLFMCHNVQLVKLCKGVEFCDSRIWFVCVYILKVNDF